MWEQDRAHPCSQLRKGMWYLPPPASCVEKKHAYGEDKVPHVLPEAASNSSILTEPLPPPPILVLISELQQTAWEAHVDGRGYLVLQAGFGHFTSEARAPLRHSAGLMAPCWTAVRCWMPSCSARRSVYGADSQWAHRADSQSSSGISQVKLRIQHSFVTSVFIYSLCIVCLQAVNSLKPEDVAYWHPPLPTLQAQACVWNAWISQNSHVQHQSQMFQVPKFHLYNLSGWKNKAVFGQNLQPRTENCIT